jgi:iron complex outermembrane receptor protein
MLKGALTLKNMNLNLRTSLLAFTACTMVGMIMTAAPARAQSADNTMTATTGDTTERLTKIKIIRKNQLFKEQDLPSAVSHVTKQEIAQQGEVGSVQSVLRETPSVNEYQSGIGQSVPVVTIRGVRLYELTETLDGNPLSDILSGGQGGFLDNNIGSPITLDQLSDTTVFPGVAPPDDQGFGSGGGTIAYTTKDPDKTRSAEIFAGVGQFDTSHAGFELNTGALSDGTTAMLRYDQGYTSGYTDDTDQRYGDMIFKAVHPYDDGLSKVSLFVIYNRGFGYINTAPLPTALIQQNGYSYNFPKSLTFTSENNKYLTADLNDDTYVNPNVSVSASLFYNRSSASFLSYQNPNSINYSPAFPYQITFQVPYFATGAIGPTAQSLGVATVQNPTLGGFLQYDPLSFFPGGASAAAATDPNSGVPYNNETTGYAYGESAELNNSVTNTIGFTPRASFFLPNNTIKVGGLIAKENSSGQSYIYGDSDVPEETGYNETSIGGGAQRTVYQVFAQDTIDLLDDKLHIEPAATISSTYTSSIANLTFNNGPTKLQNFNSVGEPYLGITYDLPDHFTAYASYGKGGYFAPIGDYAQNNIDGQLSLAAPKPEIVHLYEAGLRYQDPNFYANFDGYYQKITDADSFFVNYATGAADEGNDGAEQFQGYEADLKYRVTPQFTLGGNASYTRAVYLNSYFANDTPFEDQFGYVFKGDPLASVPAWLATITGDYTNGNFTAHAEEQYTGQQYITYDFSPALSYTGPNITNNPGCNEDTNIPNECLALATVPDSKNQSLLKTIIGGAIPFQMQPSFLISNFVLGYDFHLPREAIKTLHVALNVENLFDAHYVSHLYNSFAEIPNGHGGYAITSAYTSEFFGPPRVITVELSAKF